MIEHWKLNVPKLLISVTGGAKRFEMNQRLQEVIQRGIVNTAVSTGAWVITGGSSAGVMGIVGEAIQQRAITSGDRDKIVCLGIPTWGCIAGREQLDGEGEAGLFPADYTLDAMDYKTRKKDVFLDHNHTHFLLIDDGTEGKFGREIEFRATLEKMISERDSENNGNNVEIPVILLVVEGGVNTIRTVYEAVENDNPVLIIDGSGRAANFLSKGYKLTKTRNDEETVYPPNFDEEMTEFATTTFEWLPKEDIEAKISDCLCQMKICLGRRSLVNIYSASENDFMDLDRAILYALLRANKSDVATQLALSLAWNRCDIARQEIFTPVNREEWRKLNLYDAMFTALIQNRADFVQLFIDNGVDFRSCFNKEILWNLYAVSLEDTSSSIVQLLTYMIQHTEHSILSSLSCTKTELDADMPDLIILIGRVIVNLLKAENLNPYSDTDRFVVDVELKPVMKWIGNHNHSMQAYSGDLHKRSQKRKKFDIEVPERDLMLWAVLMNRIDLADMFWRMSKDQLGGALLASALLKAMAGVAETNEETDLKKSLLANAQLFEDKAVGVLSECYHMNKVTAHQLLVRKLPLYGDSTLLSLAFDYEMMDFMGHTCCQTKLSDLWKGNMSPNTSHKKICSVILMPFLIPTVNFNISNSSEQQTNIGSFDDRFVPLKKSDKGSTGTSQDEDTEALRHIFSSSKTQSKKLYKVQCFGDQQNTTISVFNAVYHFYCAPVTTYIANILTYIFYLGLFSFFLLTNLKPIGNSNTPSIVECIVWFWTFMLVTEEIRQVVSKDQKSLGHKISSWFLSIWNRFDLMMYLLFIVSIILRCTLGESNFVWARNFYSCTVACFYLRLMHSFYVSKNVGPKIIMIKKMLIDLWFFFLIFLVVILSFGVAYHAIIYPNSSPSWNIIKTIIYIPYWQIYGELFLDTLEGQNPGTDCTMNRTEWEVLGTKERCAEHNSITPLLLAVYMILTSILLVNLLIAMFSFTFSAVQDNCEKVWKYNRMSLVYKYFDRPALAPPLIFLSHIYRLIKWVLRYINEDEVSNGFKQRLSDEQNTYLSLFERAAMEDYLNIHHIEQQQQLQTKVATTADRIEKVIQDIEQIKNEVQGLDVAGKKKPDTDDAVLVSSLRSPSGVKKTVQTSIDELARQNLEQDVKLEQLMELMELVLHQQALFLANAKEKENQDSMFTSGI